MPPTLASTSVPQGCAVYRTAARAPVAASNPSAAAAHELAADRCGCAAGCSA
jgi:hypothetical protein